MAETGKFDRRKFWRDPAASSYTFPFATHCRPEFYLDLDNVTRLVVSTIARYCAPNDASILEIGCGTGRNLVGLVDAGYTNVSGVEISAKAVAVGREQFPEYKDIDVQIAPIEDIIKSLPEYDVIYTQGCLMHLPYDVDWVIDEIKRKAKHLIMTIEVEAMERKRFHVWGRSYEEHITKGGEWFQIETENGSQYPPLRKITIKRVFVRDER